MSVERERESSLDTLAAMAEGALGRASPEPHGGMRQRDRLSARIAQTTARRRARARR